MAEGSGFKVSRFRTAPSPLAGNRIGLFRACSSSRWKAFEPAITFRLPAPNIFLNHRATRNVAIDA